MMAFTKEIIRNEVLLRFGEVGEDRGKLVGALQRSLEQVLEDGVIISSKALDPEQLSTIPNQSGTPLADVLGEVNAQTIVDNQLMIARIEAGQANVVTLTEQLDAARIEIQRLKDLLAQPAEVEAVGPTDRNT